MRKLALIVAMGLLLAACGGGNGGDAKETKSPSPQATRPATTAKIKILSPKEGETIKGSTVNVKLELTGARIIPETKNELTPDEGHLHVMIDGKTQTMTYGTEQSISGVAPGSHGLSVEFVAADHAPFNPRYIVSVSFRTVAS